MNQRIIILDLIHYDQFQIFCYYPGRAMLSTSLAMLPSINDANDQSTFPTNEDWNTSSQLLNLSILPTPHH